MRKHGDHDQSSHGNWARGVVEPGATAIPEGHVRLFHITTLSNAENIRREGLDPSKSRLHDFNVPSVWATAGTRSAQAERAMDEMEGTYAVVEFHVDPADLDVGSGATAEELEARRADVTLLRAVTPDEIIAVHEPSHAAYRTLSGPDYREAVLAGEYDWVFEEEQGFEAYQRAIESIKAEMTKHYPGGQDHDQSTHGNRSGTGETAVVSHTPDRDTPEWKAVVEEIRSQGKGNCFEAAVTLGFNKDELGLKNVRIVQGTVMGQGEMKGVRFVHAWVEADAETLTVQSNEVTFRNAYDFASGNEAVMPDALYRHIAQAEDITEYTWDEAAFQMIDKGIYGPWEEELVGHV